MNPSQQICVCLRRIRRTGRADVATFTLFAMRITGHSPTPEPALSATSAVWDHWGPGSCMYAPHRPGSMPSGAFHVVPPGRPRRYFSIDGVRHRATNDDVRSVGLLKVDVEGEARRRSLFELEFSAS
jgi:hypothetical protein